jgi:MscS family membrane protein
MCPEWILRFSLWIKVGGVVLFTWLALWVKRLFYRRLTQKYRGSADPLSLEEVNKVITALILFIGVLVMLQLFGIDVVPIVTVSGIGAAAIAFMGRDVFANFFGGIMIYLSRPFSLGDFIEMPGKAILGNVEEIGWYFTTLRDPQKRPLYIPNALFATELLLNHSRITHRLIDEKIRLRNVAGERAKVLIEEIRKLVKREKEIDANQPVNIFLHSITPFGLVIELKAYTRTTSYQEYSEVKQRILLDIYGMVFEGPL